MQTTDVDEKELTRARDTAYRYLAFRARSLAEVEVRLRAKGFAEPVVRETISTLARLGYVDDAKFAVQWAESRIKLRNFGRRRIERELRDKGIDGDIIRGALTGLLAPGEESETAKKAARKKMQTMPSLDADTRRRRLAGFLERKGFSYEIIRDILSHVDTD